MILVYDEQLKKTDETRASIEGTLEDLLKALRSEKAVKMLNGDEDLKVEKIIKNIDLDEKLLDALFEYAKLLYDCGEFEGNAILANTIESMRMLYFFENASNNKEDVITTLWGQLSGHIILDQKEKYCSDFIRLKDSVDALVVSFCNFVGIRSRTS